MNRTEVLNGPALEPPPGVDSNLDNPPNENALFHGITVVCLVATTTAVLLRAYSRICAKRQIKTDDFLIFAGFGFYIGYIYCIYREIRSPGVFVHQWNVRLRELADFLYILFIGYCIYGVVIACVKAAILLEWIRIFVPTPRRNGFYYGCWALIAFNTLYYAAAIIALNVACTPYKYTWDKTIPGGHCVNVSAIKISSAYINIFSDLAIIILPQLVIWKLQMPTRKKIGISLIFAIGFIGCLAAIFRVSATVIYVESRDATYNVSPMALWALGEMTSVFLVACVPAAASAFIGQGVLARVARRLASWTGLPSRKPLPENPARSWAQGNAGRNMLLNPMITTDEGGKSGRQRKWWHKSAKAAVHVDQPAAGIV